MQGPKEATVGDFWTMMWEFKSKVIVMLYNEEEGTCYQYWPEEEEEYIEYGRVNVILQSQTSYGDFLTRKFFIYDKEVCFFHL